MIAALALLVFAFAVRTAALRMLPDAAWARRAPRLGVLAWQSVTIAVPVSVVLAGLALAVPLLPAVTGDTTGILGACAFLLREHYETPGGIAAGISGLAGALALSGRLAVALADELRVVRRLRIRQRDGLALVSRTDLVPGAWVIDDDRAAIFCIPGHRAQVVVTTAALSVLTPQQRVLALAHEEAHLSGRHHLALSFAAAARRALPRSRLLAAAATEIATLVEMHADDRAARGGERSELAAALVKLAGGPRPEGALAVNGGAAVQRVQRLLATGPALPLRQRWSIQLGVATLCVAPVLIAAAPALEAVLRDYCSVALHA
ncbi:M56 family metallopeptidase [Nocardioides sp. L-11A]|uniref:M56 family metallopeptidase n=1 Tax=Nocardioides sp. L-11A TaxID=3043848 RepID=UPI00249CEA14|nr:M56 family metallopeptidase [Nocardioides sp. L-11A]